MPYARFIACASVENIFRSTPFWSLLCALICLIQGGLAQNPQQPAAAAKETRFLLLPQEPLLNQASTNLGKLTGLSWSAFSLKKADKEQAKPSLEPVNLEDLRTSGGWAGWLAQARQNAQDTLATLKPEVRYSEQNLAELVAYEAPFAASLLIDYEGLYQRWEEQLGQEMLLLIDGQERLWLVAALSPNRQAQLREWQVSNALSGQFFLLNEQGLQLGGRVRRSAKASSP